MDFPDWPEYVPVAVRRRRAELEQDRLRRKGESLSPVTIEGRAIARTFWGKAWCANLERYGDFANRLPRGRSYVRSGAVVDLAASPGEIRALVAGTELYRVQVSIAVVDRERWRSLCRDCAGSIDSLVELLEGRFSSGAMERICRLETGLFPAPPEIRFTCSCPDWARMCKHVAAALYGLGARLDVTPELLFRLRHVDEKELIQSAGRDLSLSRGNPAPSRLLRAEGLGELFGIDLASADEPRERTRRARRSERGPSTPKGASPPKAQGTPMFARGKHLKPRAEPRGRRSRGTRRGTKR